MADLVQVPEESSADDRENNILRVARRRFQTVEERDNNNRKLAVEDLKFAAGEQWPVDIKNRRQTAQRPCLTVNKIPQFIRQVTNEQRQARPAIKVSPIDSDSDVKTANVVQGLIRHIEVDSGADTAYDTAFEAAVTHGRGYWRILTEYTDDMSFDLDIKIKRIRNPFTVYIDPSCQEPDYSDMQWAFIIQEMNRDVFMFEYPDVHGGQMEQWTTIGDMWVQQDIVRVAEYFYISRKRRTLIEYAIPVTDANGMEAVAVARGFLDEVKKEIPDGRFEVLRDRTVHVPTVNWCKHNGYKILEENEWPGRWIPIVPVIGDETDIEGKVTLSGLIRHAKDPQRMVNFWASAEAETIASAPKAPWIIAAGQIEGYEDQWAKANIENLAYLPYKERSIDGRLVPPPQRNNFEPAVQSITNARLLASDDMKSTMGIYDPALGNRSNETSGKGIIARQQQSDRANMHYSDNLRRSLRHAGKILIDLIPRIYDTARVVRILGEDGSEDLVALNQEFIDPKTKKPVLYDLTVGKYDVTVDAGPSYQSKRQEAVEAMSQIVGNVPELMSVIGDLLVKNMDWPGADEMGARLRLTIPPDILAADNGEDGEPDREAQLEAMLKQLQDQLEKINAYAQEKEQEADELKHGYKIKEEELVLKARELDIKKQELALKERVEMRKLDLQEEELEVEALRETA